MSMQFEEPTFFPGNASADSQAEPGGWAWQLAGGLVVVAAGLVITFMMAGVLQWREDIRAENVAAAQARLSWDRHDPARTQYRAVPVRNADFEVGALN